MPKQIIGPEQLKKRVERVVNSCNTVRLDGDPGIGLPLPYLYRGSHGGRNWSIAPMSISPEWRERVERAIEVVAADFDLRR